MSAQLAFMCYEAALTGFQALHVLDRTDIILHNIDHVDQLLAHDPA